MPHTPGPWTFRTDPRTGDCGIRSAGTSVLAETFADIRHADEFARDEAIANANLIIAAPDMLAALRNFVEADAITFSEALDIAALAIAKATAGERVSEPISAA
jgi:hypothetical protein